MRQFRFLILLLAIGIVAAPVLRAQSGSASDSFLDAYMTVQKAQKLEEGGSYAQALAKYKYAAALLQQIRDKTPDWQPVIVTYRLGKTSEAIAALQKKIAVEGGGPAATEPEPPPLPENPDTGGGNTPQGTTPSAGGPEVTTPTGSGADAFDQMRADYLRMKKELDQLKIDYATEHDRNTALTQKLDDTVKQLDKARVDYAQTQAQLKQAEEDYKDAVANNTKDQQGKKEMEDEIARLQNELKDRDSERDAAQFANDEAENKIASLNTARIQAVKERDDAMVALGKAKEGQQQVDKLLADNAALTKKLSDAEKNIAELNANGPSKDAQIVGLKKDLADAREQLTAALKQSQENLNTMNDLQDQVERATTELAQTKAAGASSEEAKKLSDENELLLGIVKRERNAEAYRDQQKQLALEELKKLQVPSDSPLVANLNNMAQPLRLSDSERALFKETAVSISDNGVSISAEKPTAESTASPAPPPTATPPQAPSATPVPSATPLQAPAATPAPSPAASPAQEMAMATQPPLPSSSPTEALHGETSMIPPVPPALIPQAKEAKEAFDSKHYRDAEKVYKAMMEQEPSNIYILDNLGVVLFRSGKLKEAEQILRKALAVSSDDEFTLRTLGIVLYQEGDYDGDGALSKLTKAVTVNPKDAVARNYLGITAAQKGWAEAARGELETAVKLQPNYADAQFNLAVIYLKFPPVDKEGARNHYQRALELGSEPDHSFEQELKQVESASPAPPASASVKP